MCASRAGSAKRSCVMRRFGALLAIAATVACLAGAAPAAAAVDAYGDSIDLYPSLCNPTRVDILSEQTYFSQAIPQYLHGLAWVDYFGIPVAKLPPLTFEELNHSWGILLPVPSPSAIPRGRYTLHVLFYGRSDFARIHDFPVVTTVAESMTIDPGLNPDCSPITASITQPATSAASSPARTIRRAARAWRAASP